jgi:crotonobetainyl-CoA:carnitine CoA-transferase CaiB-like acyl-CoA transferase
MSRPLEGIRILEVGTFIAGPYAAMLLGAMGADVIKIEAPVSGDPSRGSADGTISPWFTAHNAGKRSLTLNLRSCEAADVMTALVRRTDVLIQNFRPGVAERLAIGYDHLREINRRLIYCSISSVGNTGPYAGLPGFDTVGQALGGLMSLLSSPDDPAPIGPALADTVTGIIAAMGVAAALHARSQTGVGQRVDTSLLAASLSLASEALVSHLQAGIVHDRFSRARIAQIYLFRCSDGLPLAVHLSSPVKFWQGLLKVTGRMDLLTDVRCRERGDRIRNYDRIREELSPIFQTSLRADWLRRLREADVPCAPVNTIDQVFFDPQVRSAGFATVRFPLRFNESGLSRNAPVPDLGQHTDEILRQIGYSDLDIHRLHETGSI